jgi:hypothetical protein
MTGQAISHYRVTEKIAENAQGIKSPAHDRGASNRQKLAVRFDGDNQLAGRVRK